MSRAPASRAGVLVARLDNAGDVLLAGPAIRAVADTGRPVHLLCGPRGRAAGELLPGVESLLTWPAPWIDPDPMAVRRGDADRLVDRVRRLGVGDAAILGSSHQSPLPLALLLRWAGVERIAAVSHEYPGSLLDCRIPGDPDLHEVERNLLVTEALGFPRPADDRLRIRAGKRHAQHRSGGVQSYVALHPGASVPARTLAPLLWREATKALVASGWPVVLTGGGEEARLTADISGDQPTVLDLGGATTLSELADVIAGAAVFVGGNTGPVHLAAAVGTPTVVVFPPTVPRERWGPWRVPHIALGDQTVPCAGCRSRTCPLPEQICLQGVGPTDIVAAVETLAATPEREVTLA